MIGCDDCEEHVCGTCLRRDYLEGKLEACHGTASLTCQVLDMATPWGTRHLVVWRADGGDGVTWDQLQAAKNEALGPEVVAIEIYPAAEDEVNEVNRRHLWEVPREVLAGLTLRRGS